MSEDQSYLQPEGVNLGPEGMAFTRRMLLRRRYAKLD